MLVGVEHKSFGIRSPLYSNPLYSSPCKTQSHSGKIPMTRHLGYSSLHVGSEQDATSEQRRRGPIHVHRAGAGCQSSSMTGQTTPANNNTKKTRVHTMRVTGLRSTRLLSPGRFCTQTTEA